MRVEAVFSDGMTRLLDGAAIGDEFTITATARITAAKECLVDVSAYGESDPTYVQGELEVKLLLSHPRRG
jgi:hypothetical protein